MEHGIAIVGAGYNWWDLIPAIVGGIIGALAGGIPAWLLAERASKESLARDRETRGERELAASFKIFTKLSVMVNDLASSLIQIEEMLERPVQPNDECSTQSRVSAFAGASPEPELQFSAEDLYILVAANETDYLSNLDLFGRRYAANVRSLETYRIRKEKFDDTIAESDDIRFGPGSIVLTPKVGPVANKLRLQARTLESLIVQLIENIRGDLVFGVGLAEQFGPKMKKYFKGGPGPSFDFAELYKALPRLFPDKSPS